MLFVVAGTCLFLMNIVSRKDRIFKLKCEKAKLLNDEYREIHKVS